MNAPQQDPTRRSVAFVTGLAVLAVLIALVFVGLRVAGFTPYVVLSDSMAPHYHAGDLVYIQSHDPTDIDVGDIIAYRAEAAYGENQRIVLHRVIAADREENLFAAKGDANNHVDADPISYDQVVGTAAFTIPHLGYLSNLMSLAFA